MVLWTYLLESSELFVIFQEEGQVLVGDVDVAVPTLLSVLLQCRAATGERVPVDLLRGGRGTYRRRSSEPSYPQFLRKNDISR